MQMLLSVDPGNDCGWALFDLDSKRLTACGLVAPEDAHTILKNSHSVRGPDPIHSVRGPDPIHSVRGPDPIHSIRALVVERPHKGVTRARKADVLTLALHAGEIAGVLRYLTGVAPVYVEPARWKGSVSKEISNNRTMAILTPSEQALVSKVQVSAPKLHNVKDAIGIGLYYLRRK